jgi:hypothetical protein
MVFKRLQLKTLQTRLIVLLLFPVFLLIFSGGIVSFLYTRMAILDQWNDSAVLKLQRAAHYIEMRLLKPLELMDMLFQLSNNKNTPISPARIMEHINTLEGVLSVEFRRIRRGSSSLTVGKLNHASAWHDEFSAHTNIKDFRS